MIVRFKKNRMYIIGGCLQQLIYIAYRRKTYMDGNPKLTHRPVSMFDIASIKHKKQDDFAYLSSFPIDRTYKKFRQTCHSDIAHNYIIELKAPYFLQPSPETLSGRTVRNRRCLQTCRRQKLVPRAESCLRQEDGCPR